MQSTWVPLRRAYLSFCLLAPDICVPNPPVETGFMGSFEATFPRIGLDIPAVLRYGVTVSGIRALLSGSGIHDHAGNQLKFFQSGTVD